MLREDERGKSLYYEINIDQQKGEDTSWSRVQIPPDPLSFLFLFSTIFVKLKKIRQKFFIRHETEITSWQRKKLRKKVMENLSSISGRSTSCGI